MLQIRKLVVYLPKLNSLVISRQKKEGTIGCLAPSDLVNFLLNLQTLEIIKLNERVQMQLLENKTKKEN